MGQDGDDGPGVQWLTFGAGFELDDVARSEQLMLTPRPALGDLVLDRALKARFGARGIERVFVAWALVEPNGAPPAEATYRKRRGKLVVEADLVDDASRPTGAQFDAWLLTRVRQVLEGWPGLG